MKFVFIVAALSFGCTKRDATDTYDSGSALDASALDIIDASHPASLDTSAGSDERLLRQNDDGSARNADVEERETPVTPAPTFPCPIMHGEPSCTTDGLAGIAIGATNIIEFEGAYTCAPVVQGAAPCAYGTCDLGRCPLEDELPPDDTEWFLVSDLDVDASCCVDFTGDGVPDNALATSFASAFLSLGENPDDALDVSHPIRQGHLLVAIGLRRDPNPMLWIARLDPIGESSPLPYPFPDDLSFKLRTSSVVPGTRLPRMRAALQAEGQGWQGETERGLIAVTSGAIGMPFEYRSIRVKVTPSSDGIRIELGTLWSLEDAARDINRVYRDYCGCWHEGPIVGLSTSSPSSMTAFAVPATPAPGCEPSGPPDAVGLCGSLHTISLPGLLQAMIVPDFDINEDGTMDSLTSGVVLTAVPMGQVLPP